MTPIYAGIAGFFVTLLVAAIVAPLLDCIETGFRNEGTKNLEGRAPGGRTLGFLEAEIFFGSFAMGLGGLALAGAWLVFKTTAKWKAWDFVLKDEHESISARYRLFLLGTAANIFAGLIGAAVYKATPALIGTVAAAQAVSEQTVATAPIDWMLIFTGILAIFTVVLAVSTILLWRETGKAAHAARGSADAAVKATMPVLFPWVTDATGLHPLTVGDSPVTHKAKLLVGFDNFGKTPGIIRQVRAKLFLTETDALPTLDFESLPIQDYQVMIPGESRAASQSFGALDLVQSIELNPTELQELLAEAIGKFRRFVLIGQVIYDDFFGLRHTARFCVKLRMWRPVETPHIVRMFQLAKGGSQYNGITSERIPKPDPLAS